jgi:hypothetical protein
MLTCGRPSRSTRPASRSGAVYPTIADSQRPEGEWGFAGTFSPNAAFVQRRSRPFTASRTPGLWKTNAADPAPFAGAGPFAGSFAHGHGVAYCRRRRFTRNGDHAEFSPAARFSNWQDVDAANLSLSFTPRWSRTAVSGNADHPGQRPGFNQDIGVALSGASFPSVGATPRHGRRAAALRHLQPNAAFVQAPIA